MTGSRERKVEVRKERKKKKNEEEEKEGERGGRGARRKSEESPEARTERGSRKRGRTTVCLGVARGVTERIVSLDILGAI